MQIKVCGLKAEASITALAKSNADLLGFIFYPPSARNIAVDDPIIDCIQKVNKHKVGVFVNADFHFILQVGLRCDLEYIQLHGEESPELVQELSQYFKVIKAFALDAHFTLEQVGRNSKGHFINFNGTAGIWRKECILDAGNWEGDTLTEDLDLSYRAQLKNWKFKYLEDVETPAELPVVISAARSQQFRWNKGGAENFRKTVWSVITAKNIPFKTKFHGVMHLLNSSMFLCVFIVAILSIPMLYIKNSYGHLGWVFEVTSFFIISTIILFICYWFTYKSIQGSSFDNFVDYIKLFFTFFSVALGFSLHNTVAVLEGHLGKRSEFVRTPKFNINSLKDSWKGNKYLTKKLSPNMVLEFALMVYFLFGMYSAIPLDDYGLFPFHLMLFMGFSFVFFKSLTSKA